MKLEVMAKYLCKGDLILHNRKKYEVVGRRLNGDNVKILYKGKGNIVEMFQAPHNQFFRVKSIIELEG